MMKLAIKSVAFSATKNNKEMAKYRKKPVVIEAVQWKGTPNNDGRSVVEVYNFLTGENVTGTPRVKSEGDNFRFDKESNGAPKLIIKTLEGDMLALRGDWIIKGVNGEFYPCKPDIFEKTYEQVSN